MTAGAFGGRAELMERYDPRQPTPLQHPVPTTTTFLAPRWDRRLGQVYTAEAAVDSMRAASGCGNG